MRALAVAAARIEVFAASSRDDRDAIDHARAAEEPQDARPRLIRRGESRLMARAYVRLAGTSRACSDMRLWFREPSSVVPSRVHREQGPGPGFQGRVGRSSQSHADAYRKSKKSSQQQASNKKNLYFPQSFRLLSFRAKRFESSSPHQLYLSISNA